MDLEAKKNILVSIIAATDDEKIIEHLITMAWQKEIEPPKSLLQIESSPPKTRRQVLRIKIHGQEYRSLRYACVEIWGMSEGQYTRILKEVKKGVDIHDLLAPRREPQRKILPTDSMGVVEC